MSQTLQDKRTDEAPDVMWMRAKSHASANGIPVCESAKRPVRSAFTAAASVVMSGTGQSQNREISNNFDMRAQFRLSYFEIVDTVTGEIMLYMK